MEGNLTAIEVYDKRAESYAESARESTFKEELEFPATTSLIPEVDDKRILDTGCGTGFYTEWLHENGAEVVGVDGSEEMLDRARERLDEGVKFYQADLSEEFRIEVEHKFDGVVGSLVFGYIEDWEKLFSQLYSHLASEGFLVFSVAHPFTEFSPAKEDDTYYFDVELKLKDLDVEVPYYRRPFSEVISPLLKTGFQIDEIIEAEPTDQFKKERPEQYEKVSKRPTVLCIRAVK